MAKITDATRTIGPGKTFSLAEFRAMAAESRRKERRRAKRLPVAKAVECDPKSGVTLTMTDDCRVFIPMAEFHELRGAKESELRDVVLRIKGSSLEWPQLDRHFDIPRKLADVFSMRAVLSEEFGLTGNRATSTAKAAPKVNGRKGDRPKNVAAS
jgi:hypothetical protein